MNIGRHKHSAVTDFSWDMRVQSQNSGEHTARGPALHELTVERAGCRASVLLTAPPAPGLHLLCQGYFIKPECYHSLQCPTGLGVGLELPG